MSRNGEDKIFYWCDKCKRWTPSHNTLKHGLPDTPATPATPAAPPVPADAAVPPAGGNMAMDQSLVSTSDSDDEDGAW